MTISHYSDNLYINNLLKMSLDYFNIKFAVVIGIAFENAIFKLANYWLRNGY